MPVLVSYCRAQHVGGGLTLMGDVRARETIAVGSSGSLTAQAGEVVRLVSTEGSVAWVAFGTAPDASATTSSTGTSAGFALAPGATDYVQVAAGDSLAVGAV